MNNPASKDISQHGTAVSINGQGILIIGPSGSGKSDLALRLIDRGAILISDDQVLLRQSGSHLIMSGPKKLQGYLEVRGLGIVPFDFVQNIPLCLMVYLVSDNMTARLPDETDQIVSTVPIKTIKLQAFDPSAPIKIELAIKHLDDLGKLVNINQLNE